MIPGNRICLLLLLNVSYFVRTSHCENEQRAAINIREVKLHEHAAGSAKDSIFTVSSYHPYATLNSDQTMENSDELINHGELQKSSHILPNLERRLNILTARIFTRRPHHSRRLAIPLHSLTKNANQKSRRARFVRKISPLGSRRRASFSGSLAEGNHVGLSSYGRSNRSPDSMLLNLLKRVNCRTLPEEPRNNDSGANENERISANQHEPVPAAVALPGSPENTSKHKLPLGSFTKVMRGLESLLHNLKQDNTEELANRVSENNNLSEPEDNFVTHNVGAQRRRVFDNSFENDVSWLKGFTSDRPEIFPILETQRNDSLPEVLKNLDVILNILKQKNDSVLKDETLEISTDALGSSKSKHFVDPVATGTLTPVSKYNVLRDQDEALVRKEEKNEGESDTAEQPPFMSYMGSNDSKSNDGLLFTESDLLLIKKAVDTLRNIELEAADIEKRDQSNAEDTKNDSCSQKYAREASSRYINGKELIDQSRSLPYGAIIISHQITLLIILVVVIFYTLLTGFPRFKIMTWVFGKNQHADEQAMTVKGSEHRDGNSDGRSFPDSSKPCGRANGILAPDADPQRSMFDGNDLVEILRRSTNAHVDLEDLTCNVCKETQTADIAEMPYQDTRQVPMHVSVGVQVNEDCKNRLLSCSDDCCSWSTESTYSQRMREMRSVRKELISNDEPKIDAMLTEEKWKNSFFKTKRFSLRNDKGSSPKKTGHRKDKIKTTDKDKPSVGKTSPSDAPNSIHSSVQSLAENLTKISAECSCCKN